MFDHKIRTIQGFTVPAYHGFLLPNILIFYIEILFQISWIFCLCYNFPLEKPWTQLYVAVMSTDNMN